MDGDCCCFVRVVYDLLLKVLFIKLKVIVVEGICIIFCRFVGMFFIKLIEYILFIYILFNFVIYLI